MKADPSQPSNPAQPEPPNPSRSGARGAVTLMIGTLFSRVTGLLRNIIMFRLFSPEVTDAFLVAWRVPNLFRALLAEGALINSFVPIYKGLEKREGRRLASALFSLLLVTNAALTALMILAAPWIVDLFIREGSTINVALAVRLARIVFPFLAMISFSALAMGILNAEERFFAPAWAPVAFNVVTIGLMLLFPNRPTMLAVAFVLGGAAQLVVQLPAMIRYNVLPTLGLWWHQRLGRVLKLMVPFTFTTGALQVLNLLAYWVLSGFPQGAISGFEASNLVFTLALGLFSVSPSLSFYSRLSADAAEAPGNFIGTLQAGLRFITFLTVPTGLYVALLAAPIISTLFPGVEASITTFAILALAPLGLAIFPWGVSNFLLRPFYVRERVRAPIVVSVSFTLLNALLFLLLVPRYGIAGLSWATALVGWLQLGVLLAWLRRDEALPLAVYLRYALRVWLAAALAVWLAYLAILWVSFPGEWLGAVLRIALSGSITLVIYAAVSWWLGLPELVQLVRRLRR